MNGAGLAGWTPKGLPQSKARWPGGENDSGAERSQWAEARPVSKGG
ncbi:hypothetical protein [Desulforamulus reducens]|nr:hypothetical protein [Desulforamulus reducens]